MALCVIYNLSVELFPQVFMYIDVADFVKNQLFQYIKKLFI